LETDKNNSATKGQRHKEIIGGVNQDCWWFSSNNPGFRCQCSGVSWSGENRRVYRWNFNPILFHIL